MLRERIALGVIAVALGASAETWVWTGAKDGHWNDPANWTVGGAVATTVPGMMRDDDRHGGVV